LPAYHLAVLFGGFGLLTLLAIRGRSIFVVAPLCAVLVLSLSGMDPLAGMTGPFMRGFSDYLRRFFLIFALGAAFGKLMDESGAAVTIARAIVQLCGARRACLAVVLACAVLTYGGVSLFVVGFSVFPLAVQLFRAADLPRRFIPAAIAFGSVTFTMTSAGSPEIQNLIPMQYLVDPATKRPLTDARAGWPASLIVAVFMFSSGQCYLEWAIGRERQCGIRFEPRPGDRSDDLSPGGNSCPPLVAALLPVFMTLLGLNALPRLLPIPEDATLAVFFGVVTAVTLLWPWIPAVWQSLGDGFLNGLVAIGATCSVVGFGSALQDLPAFDRVVQWVTAIPGDPLVGAAVAVAVIAGIAGSASGGQGIALPIIKPIYIDQLGVAPRALHRVVAIASGSLDSLPANGYLVMLIRNICGETHARAYGPIFVTTVLIPLVGTALAILLFRLVPAWTAM
jgi:H+/gluconate symporter-like permease